MGNQATLALYVAYDLGMSINTQSYQEKPGANVAKYKWLRHSVCHQANKIAQVTIWVFKAQILYSMSHLALALDLLENLSITRSSTR